MAHWKPLAVERRWPWEWLCSFVRRGFSGISEKELSDIRFYTFRLTDYLSLFLKCDRSFLFEFVFTEKEHHYFEHKEFSDTDLLLYGMRSYSYIREIDFESDSFLTM